MTHTLEHTREILKQIQHGMGPLPPGFDLETLVCQTVSAVANESDEQVFVIEPPSQAIHVQGEAADLIQALSGVLRVLKRLSPRGSHVNIWTFTQNVGTSHWVAIRIRESGCDEQERDGAALEQAMAAMCQFVERMGANLEVSWDSTGAAELSLWLPCCNLVEYLDTVNGVHGG